MTGNTLAIDPGLSGAIAVLSIDYALLDVHDIPCLLDGANSGHCQRAAAPESVFAPQTATFCGPVCKGLQARWASE